MFSDVGMEQNGRKHGIEGRDRSFADDITWYGGILYFVSRYAF